MRNTNWLPYAPGATVAGLTVLTVIQKGKTQPETWYSVRYPCCGREVEMTHYKIAKRDRAGHNRCQECATGGVMLSSETRPGAGITDERGDWWPRLGPMGSRYGDGNPPRYPGCGET